MRRFELHRTVDETGISGEGIVAQGVEFDPTPAEIDAADDAGPNTAPNRKVAMQWMSHWPTTVVFHDRGIESVEALHGHGGKTVIVWDDNPDGSSANYDGAMADLAELVRLARAHVTARRPVDDTPTFVALADHLDLNYPEPRP